MITPISAITFKGSSKIYYEGENKIVDYFSDNNKLLSRNKYDKSDRHIQTNWFDEYGNDTGFMNKKYTEDGFIETCKTKTQEYTRTTHKFIKNGFQHYTEEYISKSKPEANYFNESVKDLLGNLIKMLSNGKVIFEKKL